MTSTLYYFYLRQTPWMALFPEADWREYLDGPMVEAKAQALRIRTWSGSVHNRPRGWVAPVAAVSAGSSSAPLSG